MNKEEEICPIHKIKLESYIREDVSRWHGENEFNYYEDYYCPMCEKREKEAINPLLK